MLIPSSMLYDEALDTLKAEDLPLVRTLDGIAKEALQNDTIYAQYHEADPATVKALAYGVLLGMAIICIQRGEKP
jgi:hypothetical protein